MAPRSLRSLLLLCSTLLISEAIFIEDSCSYTGDFLFSTVLIDGNQEHLLGIVPPNKAQFSIMMTTSENVNFKVVTMDGTVLSIEKPETNILNHHGMSMKLCGSNCDSQSILVHTHTRTHLFFLYHHLCKNSFCPFTHSFHSRENLLIPLFVSSRMAICLHYQTSGLRSTQPPNLYPFLLSMVGAASDPYLTF
jgi:hypothetical protein